MITQRSQELSSARAGMVTASQFHKIMHGGDKALRTLAAELRASLNGEPPRTFSAASTAWGEQHEPQARALFEFNSGLEVTECGLIVHPEHFWIGASPDGLIGDDALWECKCPFNPENHEEIARSGLLEKYRPQVQGQLFVTGRGRAYFVSFDPRRLAEGSYALAIEVVQRDDLYIARLERKLLAFWRDYVVGGAPPTSNIKLELIPTFF